MLKSAKKQEILFERSEYEKCLNILKDHDGAYQKDEINDLSQFLRKFAFFRQMPCKYVEIREQELNSLIEKCLKYMQVISFNPQDILIERGKKIESIYLVCRGQFGLYVKRRPEEIHTELMSKRKMFNTEHHEAIGSSKIASKAHFKFKESKLDTLTKLRKHQLGSLAKDNISKFHVSGEIYRINEVGEVLPGSHLFENAINEPQVSEYTVLAKEHCVLIAISISDYHQAMHELRAIYKNRYKLLLKNFLTADDVSLNKIAMYFTELNCSPNEVIFKEGDISDNFYCVASGEIHLLQDRKKRDTVARGASYLYGYRNLVDTVITGDFFGDEWFYEEKERKYTAVAKSEGTSLLCLTVPLLTKFISHHPEMALRLRNFMELKREFRRRKNNPLDKKRSRDYHINLTDFKGIINNQTRSLNLEENIEKSKSEKKNLKLRMQSLPDASPKAKTRINSLKQLVVHKEGEIKCNMVSSLSSIEGFKFSSLGNIKSEGIATRHQSFQSLRPEFKCKIPPGSTIQNFHSRKHSIETDFANPVKKNMNSETFDPATKSYKSAAKKRLIAKSVSTAKLSSKDLSSDFEFVRRASKDAKNCSSASSREGLFSVKDQINSLTTISSKIDELSKSITHQLYLIGVHDTKTVTHFSHKYTRSTQIMTGRPKIWPESAPELESFSLRERMIKENHSLTEETARSITEPFETSVSRQRMHTEQTSIYLKN